VGNSKTCLIIEAGRPDDAAPAAQLIAETDVTLFSFCGGGDVGAWVELSEWEWFQDHGVYWWAMSHPAGFDGQLVGLLVNYPSRSRFD
jgi:hypothetical protein